MAKIAVLASGSGSNFEAATLALRAGGRHRVALLACDKPGAFALERAERLGVPTRIVSYKGKTREAAESELIGAIQDSGAALVVLAGFMRILSADFVQRFRDRMINIHPSLLPAYPGVHSIERAFAAGEKTLGVTVHFVDEGMDSGPIIEQVRVPREATLAETEAAIHRAEHELYPRIITALLDSRESGNKY